MSKFNFLKIIDRYIFWEVISPFFLSLFVYALILLTDAIIRSIEIFITNKVALSLILRFLVTSLPFILQVVIPMSVLTGTLIAFGRLSSDSEITALRANGISLYRMSIPVFIFALLSWGLCQYITVIGIPKTGQYRNKISYEILESNINIGLKPHVFNDAFEDLIIYCDELHPRTNVMGEIFIYNRQKAERTSYIFARNGIKQMYPENHQVIISLTDGIMHEVSEGKQGNFSTTRFQNKQIMLAMPSQEDTDVSLSDEEQAMSFIINAIYEYEQEIKRKNDRIAELKLKRENLQQKLVTRKSKRKKVITDNMAKEQNKKIKQRIENVEKNIAHFQSKLKTDHRRLNKFYIVFHKKFAFPIACFVFILVGIPLGIRSRTSGKSTGFSISLALILFYYILYIGGEGIGREGTIAPWIGVWSANTILMFIGLYLFYKVARERPFHILQYVGWKSVAMVRKIVHYLKKGPKPTAAGNQKQKTTLLFNHSFPRILDRYVSWEFIRVFFLLCLIIVSITIIVQFISDIKYLLKYGAQFSDFLSYNLLRIPFFLVLSIHVAVLIATILTINMFARNNELTAMKACGVSLLRAAIPILVIAMMIALGVYFFNERVVPNTNKLAQDIYDYKIKQKSKPSLFTHNKNWYRGSQNSIYSFSSFDQRLGQYTLNDFLLYNLNERFLPQRKIVAQKVLWDQELQCWFYQNGKESVYNEDGTLVHSKPFDRLQSHLTEDVAEFTQEIKESDKMNRQELTNYIDSLSKKGIDTTIYKTDLLAKISMPMISWVIALFGIPFAITFQRSGTLVGIGFSIFIGMVYFVFYRVGISLGHSGEFPPFLAAWGANILFIFIGLFLILRAKT
ncbi:LptF/LptG family permease [candidate division CSSED10-310 bacterium]|uniref:LptF/LptG family permease n=1 Tax=candidate division CSSED10-310 bacterium TaxID=2855610 RepID=A0ABV6Z5L4_UNCC1